MAKEYKTHMSTSGINIISTILAEQFKTMNTM